MRDHRMLPRIYLVAFGAVIAWCVAVGSVLPAMFIGLPTIYGRWLMVVYGITQHAGLAEDVLDITGQLSNPARRGFRLH